MDLTDVRTDVVAGAVYSVVVYGLKLLLRAMKSVGAVVRWWFTAGVHQVAIAAMGVTLMAGLIARSGNEMGPKTRLLLWCALAAMVLVNATLALKTWWRRLGSA